MWAVWLLNGARTPFRVVICKLELIGVELALSISSLLLPPLSIPVTKVPSININHSLAGITGSLDFLTFCLRCLGKPINPGWIRLKAWAVERKEERSQDYVCQWHYKFVVTTPRDPLYHRQSCYVSLVGFLSCSLKCWFFNTLHFPEDSNSSTSFLLSVNGFDFHKENRGHQLRIPPNFCYRV